MPKRAFVLAAGYGTRMLPLSRDLPKPLMPLWGKPLLQHTLEMLVRWGVRDVLINLHHKPDEILGFIRQHSDFGLRIALSYEPEILGTGGALRKAGWFFDDQPFWLINSDVAAEVDPQPLWSAFRHKNVMAALWLHPSRGPRTVEMRRGRIIQFTVPRPGGPNTFTFCGLHLLSPHILRYLPASGFAGIIGAYNSAMRRGERVVGVCAGNSYWADLGTPLQYVEAHREIRMAAIAEAPGGGLFDPRSCREAKNGHAFVAVGSDCIISPGAKVVDSILWDGARVSKGATIHHGVIGRKAEVKEHVEGIACRGDVGLDAQEIEALMRAGFSPAKTTIYPMPQRGSARAFTRIREGKRGAILIRYNPEREENTLYCAHAHFLKQTGLRVPNVLVDRPDACLAVMEDLGSRSLEDAVRRVDRCTVECLYKKVLDQVIRLHEKGTGRAQKTRYRLMPPFDASLYRWERALFDKQLLVQRMGLCARVRRSVDVELARAARRLLREPLVLIHRDLQSSNILLTADGPAFIDFQGMRMGPAAYDLASLLCDPYVGLNEDVQLFLLAYYNQHARVPVSEVVFRLAAVERLAQAMGAYARLSRIPGMEHFERHLVQAGRQLRTATATLGDMSAMKQMAERIAFRNSITIDTRKKACKRGTR